MYTTVQHYRIVGKNCANQTSRASKETGNLKGWTLKSRMLTGRLDPLWQASGPMGWVRPKQAGSQREYGSGRLVAPSLKMRMAQWPHQDAEGTRITRSSAVHVRLCGRQCTEHWLLFARTPKRQGRGGRESIMMKTKMLKMLKFLY